MTKKNKQTLKFTYNHCNDPKDKRIDTYVGEVKNGIMHGKGKYITHTGSKYIGTFKDGKIFSVSRICSALNNNYNNNVGELIWDSDDDTDL